MPECRDIEIWRCRCARLSRFWYFEMSRCRDMEISTRRCADMNNEISNMYTSRHFDVSDISTCSNVTMSRWRHAEMLINWDVEMSMACWYVGKLKNRIYHPFARTVTGDVSCAMSPPRGKQCQQWKTCARVSELLAQIILFPTILFTHQVSVMRDPTKPYTLLYVYDSCGLFLPTPASRVVKLSYIISWFIVSAFRRAVNRRQTAIGLRSLSARPKIFNTI